MMSPPSARGHARELGIVSVRDRLDDREAQSVTVVVAGSGAAESLEGLEQALELVGWDGRSAVRDRHEGVPVAGSGGDLEGPPGALWRIALSIRFATRRSSSRGSPVVGAWSSVARTSETEARELLSWRASNGLGGEARGRAARGARARLARG